VNCEETVAFESKHFLLREINCLLFTIIKVWYACPEWSCFVTVHSQVCFRS